METILKELFYIFDGWLNYLLLKLHLKTKINRELFLYRLSKCQSCKHRKKYTCGLCGCFLKAKVCTTYPISEKDNKSIGGCPANPPLW